MARVSANKILYVIRVYWRSSRAINLHTAPSFVDIHATMASGVLYESPVASGVTDEMKGDLFRLSMKEPKWGNQLGFMLRIKTKIT